MGATSNKSQRQGYDGVVLLWMLLVTGLLPFVGFLIVGSWNQTELGLGTLLLIFTGHELVQEYRGKRRT